MDTLDPRLLKALAVVISEDHNQLKLVIAKGEATLAQIDREGRDDVEFLEDPAVQKLIADIGPLVAESKRSLAVLDDGLNCLIEMATAIDGTEA